jgi:hypothetical protein
MCDALSINKSNERVYSFITGLYMVRIGGNITSYHSFGIQNHSRGREVIIIMKDPLCAFLPMLYPRACPANHIGDHIILQA